MDYEFESIIPWNGEHDTGRDARQKLDRNFAKIKANFEELGDAKFVTTAFFARIFGIDGEDGAQVDINDTEAVITAVKVKFGLYSESFVSAKGLNPDSGSEPGGATTLAALTDVSITTTPKDGQVLAYDITMNKWKPVDMEATAGIDEAQLAQYLTTNNYAKKADITAALTDYALKTTRITAGTGLTGGGTLAQDVTLSLATVGTAGTYTKVTVDSYGRVTGHSTLAQSDIPALAISKITGLQTALDAKLNKSVFEELFEKVWVSGYGYAIRAKLAFYSDDWISAKGLNSDAGSTTGGVDENEVLQIVENAGYITSAALSGYATQSWVRGLGYMSQGTADGRYYYGHNEVDTSFNNATAGGGYYVVSNRWPSDGPDSSYRYGALAVFNTDGGGNRLAQLYISHHSTGGVYTRMFYDSWSEWRRLLDDYCINDYALTPSNYTDYTVTKTGGGASGTWGIGITGNAGTATRLATARTIWGKSFDGTGNVDGNITVNYGYVFLNYGWFQNNQSGFGLYNQEMDARWYATANGWTADKLIVGTVGFSTGGYVQIGSAVLRYDSSNNALYVQNADGSTCGFYATGFVSAKGGNSSSGSAVAGVTELSKLHDVIISSPSNGQSLVYRDGVWKNETVNYGITMDVDWDNVKNKPAWIGSTKPSYSFSEITGTPSLSISSNSSTNLSVNVEGASKSISSLYATYLGGTTKAGLFTGLSYSSNRLTVTIGGTSRSVTINAGGSGSYLPLSGGTLSGDLVVNNGYVYVSSGWFQNNSTGRGLYNGAHDARWYANSSGWVSDKVINASVGFNVNNEFRYLHVAGTANYKGFKILNYRQNPFGIIVRFFDSGAAALQSQRESNDGECFPLCLNHLGGNVGIGTTSPSYKLHVVGSAYASGGFQNGSDIRYKHVLRDVPITVEDVANAPSFIFRWTDDTAPGEQAGTSAQYWQQVMPQVVMEADGRLSMQYGKAAMAAVITTARTVVDHEQRIRKLEQQLLNAV